MSQPRTHGSRLRSGLRYTVGCLQSYRFAMGFILLIVGDIIHVHTLGTHIIYLNSLEHANELFQKRAANYSSRPILYMLYDVYVYM